MRQAEFDGPFNQGTGDDRTTAGSLAYLDCSKRQRSADRLYQRLLGGKTGRKPFETSIPPCGARVGDLVRSEQSLQELLSVALTKIPDSRHIDRIDSHSSHRF